MTLVAYDKANRRLTLCENVSNSSKFFVSDKKHLMTPAAGELSDLLSVSGSNENTDTVISNPFSEFFLPILHEGDGTDDEDLADGTGLVDCSVRSLLK